MQTASVQLLSNASATGAAAAWPGGRGVMNIVGTFGGTSATLQHLGPDNSTWLDVKTMDPATGTQATVSLTANGSIGFILPPTQIRAVLTGGAPSAMYAAAARVPE